MELCETETAAIAHRISTIKVQPLIATMNKRYTRHPDTRACTGYTNTIEGPRGGLLNTGYGHCSHHGSGPTKRPPYWARLPARACYCPVGSTRIYVRTRCRKRAIRRVLLWRILRRFDVRRTDIVIHAPTADPARTLAKSSIIVVPRRPPPGRGMCLCRCHRRHCKVRTSQFACILYCCCYYYYLLPLLLLLGIMWLSGVPKNVFLRKLLLYVPIKLVGVWWMLKTQKTKHFLLQKCIYRT